MRNPDKLGVALALIVSATPHAAGAPLTGASPGQPGAAAAAAEPPIVLPTVLVTGFNLDPGVPVVPLDAIGSRDVFGPTQVRETGAREINDLVQYIPAISTRPYNGGEASAPSFSMRGLPDDGLTEYIMLGEDWCVHSRGGLFGPGLAAGPPRQVYGSLG